MIDAEIIANNRHFGGHQPADNYFFEEIKPCQYCEARIDSCIKVKKYTAPSSRSAPAYAGSIFYIPAHIEGISLCLHIRSARYGMK